MEPGTHDGRQSIPPHAVQCDGPTTAGGTRPKPNLNEQLVRPPRVLSRVICPLHGRLSHETRDLAHWEESQGIDLLHSPLSYGGCDLRITNVYSLPAQRDIGRRLLVWGRERKIPISRGDGAGPATNNADISTYRWREAPRRAVLPVGAAQWLPSDVDWPSKSTDQPARRAHLFFFFLFFSDSALFPFSPVLGFHRRPLMPQEGTVQGGF